MFNESPSVLYEKGILNGIDNNIYRNSQVIGKIIKNEDGTFTLNIIVNDIKGKNEMTNSAILQTNSNTQIKGLFNANLTGFVEIIISGENIYFRSKEIKILFPPENKSHIWEFIIVRDDLDKCYYDVKIKNGTTIYKSNIYVKYNYEEKSISCRFKVDDEIKALLNEKETGTGIASAAYNDAINRFDPAFADEHTLITDGMRDVHEDFIRIYNQKIANGISKTQAKKEAAKECIYGIINSRHGFKPIFVVTDDDGEHLIYIRKTSTNYNPSESVIIERLKTYIYNYLSREGKSVFDKLYDPNTAIFDVDEIIFPDNKIKITKNNNELKWILLNTSPYVSNLTSNEITDFTNLINNNPVLLESLFSDKHKSKFETNGAVKAMINSKNRERLLTKILDANESQISNLIIIDAALGEESDDIYNNYVEFAANGGELFPINGDLLKGNSGATYNGKPMLDSYQGEEINGHDGNPPTIYFTEEQKLKYKIYINKSGTFVNYKGEKFILSENSYAIYTMDVNGDIYFITKSEIDRISKEGKMVHHSSPLSGSPAGSAGQLSKENKYIADNTTGHYFCNSCINSQLKIELRKRGYNLSNIEAVTSEMANQNEILLAHLRILLSDMPEHKKNFIIYLCFDQQGNFKYQAFPFGDDIMLLNISNPNDKIIFLNNSDDKTTSISTNNNYAMHIYQTKNANNELVNYYYIISNSYPSGKILGSSINDYSQIINNIEIFAHIVGTNSEFFNSLTQDEDLINGWNILVDNIDKPENHLILLSNINVLKAISESNNKLHLINKLISSPVDKINKILKIEEALNSLPQKTREFIEMLLNKNQQLEIVEGKLKFKPDNSPKPSINLDLPITIKQLENYNNSLRTYKSTINGFASEDEMEYYRDQFLKIKNEIKDVALNSIIPNSDNLEILLSNTLEEQIGEKYYKYKIVISNNRIYGIGKVNCDFVITTSGDLVLGFGHDFLSNSSDYVKFAGNIQIDEYGKISSITRKSGHYNPTVEDWMKVIEFLLDQNLIRFHEGFIDTIRRIIEEDKYSYNEVYKNLWLIAA